MLFILITGPPPGPVIKIYRYKLTELFVFKDVKNTSQKSKLSSEQFPLPSVKSGFQADCESSSQFLEERFMVSKINYDIIDLDLNKQSFVANAITIIRLQPGIRQ